jgi:DNA-binding response OmpR family regulator
MILVVDDDPNIRELIRRTLSEYSVTTSNAHDAMRIINEGSVTLLVTDFSMPGKTGLDLLSIVKRKYKIPVIMITGYTDKLEYLATRADAVLGKPFTIEQLKNTIINILDKNYENKN